MDEKQISGLCSAEFEKRSDSLYPMCFGVSCAFFALQLLSRPESEGERWSKVCDKMLQGSAQLLGLLVWKAQREGASEGKCELLYKLETAERETEELKKLRREDARATEKVVSIFATKEQSWLNERKMLRQQMGALLNELRVVEKKKDHAVSELNEKLKEMEIMVQHKDKELEEEKQNKSELEEKLKEAENVIKELRETATLEAQEHSSELWKHKSAFIEVVSNQRQLEAGMGRALRKIEATKQELEVVLERKEEADLMVQKLSMEMVKMHKDLEQKEKILSAMLRKNKLDTTEKHLLLKEVKQLKAKRKQAEIETERWRAVSESRHERHSLRSMLTSQVNSKLDFYTGARGVHQHATGSSHIGKTRSQPTDLVLEYGHIGLKKDRKEPELSPISDCYSLEGNEALAMTADVKQLESWVLSEAEKYATLIEQRHHLELDAFAEQMRIKDEKLETFRWQLMSMELESKRLQSHIEGMNEDMSQLRHDNMKLEALLLEREEELTSLKEQLASQLKALYCQNTNLNCSVHSPVIAHEAIGSEVINKRKQNEREQETRTPNSEDLCQEEDAEKEEGSSSFNQSKDVGLIAHSPENELEDDKEIAKERPVKEGRTSPGDIDVTEKLASSSQPLNKTNNSLWRMDLHALQVSYKIKRLKQQLLMLERLTGKQESLEDTESIDNGQIGIESFLALMSLLNKQVGRYQSFQEKADDLSKRMHEHNLTASGGDSSTARPKEETKALQKFLDETFQLQRHIVATGQKWVEIQSKIASGFVGVTEEINKTASFDMKRFADSVRTLFQEVQRGLEVRIARIIGDLEGTLTCEGMIHLRR